MVVIRAHKAENVAPAIRVCRDQINGMYPKRDKSSDGIWPSAAHTLQNPNSDHEAGNALDIDDDLSGIDGKAPQVDGEFALRLSMHPANNYVLHDSGLYRDGVRYPYQGSNPHTGHVHISVMESRRGDTSPWDIGQEEVMARTHAAITITDLGDPTHRAALKALAVKWSDTIIESAANHVLVHAALGADADAFIGYAIAHGLSATSITVDGPSYTSMKLRSKGLPAPIDVECAAQLAKARDTLGRIKTAGGW